MLDKVIIKVIGVTKIYKGDNVLDDVNVSFKTGNIHGIIGRNGSGKTVLFKCICGLTPLTRGKIFIRYAPAFGNRTGNYGKSGNTHT